MSRIGIKPVNLPAGVEVKVDDNNVVTVKGPKGELQEQVSKLLKIEVNGTEVIVSRSSDVKEHRSQHGLGRTLIGKVLTLHLGYSHPVEMEDPEGITTEVPSANEIIVKGIDKALVGNYAANIRKWRQPEPYKGKGIKYADEVIRRKEGKAGAQ